jgi:hypothetical protein
MLDNGANGSGTTIYRCVASSSITCIKRDYALLVDMRIV